MALKEKLKNNKKIITIISIILVILIAAFALTYTKTKLLFMSPIKKLSTILVETGKSETLETETTLKIYDAKIEKAVGVPEAQAKPIDDIINKLTINTKVTQKNDKNSVSLDIKKENEQLLKVEHYANLKEKEGLLRLYGDSNLTYITDISKVLQKQDIQKIVPYIDIINQDINKMSKKHKEIKKISLELEKKFKGSTLNEIKFSSSLRDLMKIGLELENEAKDNNELQKDVIRTYIRLLEKVQANKDYDFFELNEAQVKKGIEDAKKRVNEINVKARSAEQKKKDKEKIDKKVDTLPTVDIEMKAKLDFKNRVKGLNINLNSDFVNIVIESKTKYNVKGNVTEITADKSKAKKISKPQDLSILLDVVGKRFQKTSLYKEVFNLVK